MFRPPTKYSEYLQDVRKSIDYILRRVNAATVNKIVAGTNITISPVDGTGTVTVNATGGSSVGTLDQVTTAGNTTTNTINVGGVTSDYLLLDTSATPVLTTGMFAWNDADGTSDLRLKGNNVTLQIGQEEVVRVVNKTGANLLESQYNVVRVRNVSEGGAQGQRLAVKLAQANTKFNHTGILGLVTENINNNQDGFITAFGIVRDINTTGSLQGESWSDGDTLWLSETTAGRLTNIQPTTHPIQIGYVTYSHINNGKIFVKIDDGVDELNELHDVDAPAPNNGDLLQWNSATSKWVSVPASSIGSVFKIDYDYNIVGIKNNSNTNYNTSQSFLPNTTRVYLNGQRLTRGVGYDYVEAGTVQVSMSLPPAPTDQLIIEYQT
jgi:hypothetical protein